MKTTLAGIVLTTVLTPLAASPGAAEEPTMNWQCGEGVTTSQVLDMRDMLIKDVDCAAQTIKPTPAFGPGDVAHTCVSPNNIGDVVGFCNWNSPRTFVTWAFRSVRAVFVGELTWLACGTETQPTTTHSFCVTATHGDYLQATVLIIPLQGESYFNPSCVSENSQHLHGHPSLFTEPILMDAAVPVCSG